jgi:hypothetical protein
MAENPYESPKSQLRGEFSLANQNLFWRILPVIAFTIYCFWQYSSMTANTSFEHHPFSGGLILLHEATTMGEFAVSTGICFILIGGMSLFSFWPNVYCAVLSIFSLDAWFSLSMTLASWAGC